VREALANVLLPGLLGHSSVPVRFYACLCFRCLATALPGNLAHMIMEGNARVKAVFGKEKLTEKQLQQSQVLFSLGNFPELSPSKSHYRVTPWHYPRSYPWFPLLNWAFPMLPQTLHCN
jgi:hypothetical protein